ncbi:MAG: hypothetical protein EXR27_07740 [Betaproteobacteria bacterium]|nr:hypothetical protein [Betaproteobacteria bacterium]
MERLPGQKALYSWRAANFTPSPALCGSAVARQTGLAGGVPSSRDHRDILKLSMDKMALFR